MAQRITKQNVETCLFMLLPRLYTATSRVFVMMFANCVIMLFFFYTDINWNNDVLYQLTVIKCIGPVENKGEMRNKQFDSAAASTKRPVS